jgi:hypothetical protein
MRAVALHHAQCSTPLGSLHAACDGAENLDRRFEVRRGRQARALSRRIVTTSPCQRVNNHHSRADTRRMVPSSFVCGLSFGVWYNDVKVANRND